MNTSEFKDKWVNEDEDLCPLSEARLINLNLQAATIEFFIAAGLPNNAAPYLSFVKDSRDIYDGINKLTTQYDYLEPEYAKYIVIGSDGNGNAIAINTAQNDRIELLDHENEFVGCYMNESIHHLAELLIIFRDFVSLVQEENGDEAYVNSNFTDAQFETLKHKIEIADPKALSEDGFWKGELEMLLVNRKEFLESVKGGE